MIRGLVAAIIDYLRWYFGRFIQKESARAKAKRAKTKDERHDAADTLNDLVRRK